MNEKPKRVDEVVWTGTSDRHARRDRDVNEPTRIASPRPAKDAGRSIDPVLTPRSPRGTPVAPARPSPAQAPAKAPDRPPATPPASPGGSSRPPAAAKAPGRETPPREAAPQRTPRQRGLAIAQTVVGSFVERMKAEAQRKGGTLTLKDIEALNHEFEQKTATLRAMLEKGFQDYVRAHAAGQRPERRHSPFDRLIVTPIEELFPGRKGPIPTKPVLSRRILPGFFMAVNMMVGADAIEHSRLRAQTIFERVTADTPGDPGWAAFLADPEAQRLLGDSLVGMAVHFANPDKRAAWFMDMINNHLSPRQGEPGFPSDWRLGRPAYERMVDALFSGLMGAVGNAKAREELTRRFGPETCASIVAIMKGLGA